MRAVLVTLGADRIPHAHATPRSARATIVDQKMRAASIAAPTADMLGLAILVALNIADEYYRSRQQHSSTNGDINERAMRLEQLVDDVLAQVALKKVASAP